MSGGENLLVGIVALALVPLIAWRILRGVRTGRLPLYRSYVERGEAGSRFTLLLIMHGLSLLLVAVVAADLLFGLGLKERL